MLSAITAVCGPHPHCLIRAKPYDLAGISIVAAVDPHRELAGVNRERFGPVRNPEAPEDLALGHPNDGVVIAGDRHLCLPKKKSERLLDNSQGCIAVQVANGPRTSHRTSVSRRGIGAQWL